MVKCIDKWQFNSLEIWKDYEVQEEFIVKFPINCKKKQKEQEYREVEMVRTNVGQFQKSRFDFLGLSS